VRVVDLNKLQLQRSLDELQDCCQLLRREPPKEPGAGGDDRAILLGGKPFGFRGHRDQHLAAVLSIAVSPHKPASFEAIEECRHRTPCQARGIGDLPRGTGPLSQGGEASALARRQPEPRADLLVEQRRCVRSREALTSEGAFVTLAPNAVNGLRTLGIAEAVIAHGVAATGIELLDERGKRLALVDQSDHGPVFGAPSVTIARGVLMRILTEACDRAGVPIEYESGLSEIVDADDRVQLATKRGCRYDVTWLAACDGLRSDSRSRVFPKFPEPRFTGLIGTGGVVNLDDIPPTGGIMRMVFGYVAFFGYLKPCGGPVDWFNSYPAETADAGHRSSSYRDPLRALHHPDPAFVNEILAKIPEITRNYPIFNMPALPCWHRGRVVLVGDAAHAVGPHAGQGATMAIEDALVLASCLQAEPTVSAAFDRYEGIRRPRVEKVAALTARNSAQKRAGNWPARLLRPLILPLVVPQGVKTGRELLAYRADSALLLSPGA
jgi:2-polyprenyl-6-methoxyphenol hydroxylase-like FAD-dependent oxidoreductase